MTSWSLGLWYHFCFLCFLHGDVTIVIFLSLMQLIACIGIDLWISWHTTFKWGITTVSYAYKKSCGAQ
jgi:hypothetical protein